MPSYHHPLPNLKTQHKKETAPAPSLKLTMEFLTFPDGNKIPTVGMGLGGSSRLRVNYCEIYIITKTETAVDSSS